MLIPQEVLLVFRTVQDYMGPQPLLPEKNKYTNKTKS
jgi:hypothetical protein